MTRIAITNATVMTMNAESRILEGSDIVIDGGRIVALGRGQAAAWLRDKGGDLEIINGSGLVALPGFVQTHLHLCQALFRNLADDLELIDWLKLRIWPLEAAHTPASLRASADLALAELIKSGTTCILDMGTVHHTDAIGEAVRDAGIRAFIGKAMMDHGDAIPAGLRERTQDSLAEAEALCKRWSGQADGRIGYAFCPRFAHSCTTELLEGVAALCRQYSGAIMHTHSSETRFEVDETQRLYGCRNVPYLHKCGLTGARSVFAHGVWLDDDERRLLRDTATAIAHCPSSNLKLGSGIADIPRLLSFGVKVGLGCDGAPCNNTLDLMSEMRHAALIQKPIHGPSAMPADQVLRLATIDGARCLGLDHEIGSIELGKRADLSLLRLDRPFNGVAGALASRIVYASYPENVDTVLVDGRVLLRDGQLTTLDQAEVFTRASQEIAALVERADLS